MIRVVVDGADDHASRPRSNVRQRRALEIAAVVAGFEIFHFSGVAGCDPGGKMIEFRRVGSRSDARQIKSGLLGGPIDDRFYVADTIRHRFRL